MERLTDEQRAALKAHNMNKRACMCKEGGFDFEVLQRTIIEKLSDNQRCYWDNICLIDTIADYQNEWQNLTL